MTESEVVAKVSKVSFDSGPHQVNHFSLPPLSHLLVKRDRDLKIIAVFFVLFRTNCSFPAGDMHGWISYPIYQVMGYNWQPSGRATAIRMLPSSISSILLIEELGRFGVRELEEKRTKPSRKQRKDTSNQTWSLSFFIVSNWLPLVTFRSFCYGDHPPIELLGRSVASNAWFLPPLPAFPSEIHSWDLEWNRFETNVLKSVKQDLLEALIMRRHEIPKGSEKSDWAHWSWQPEFESRDVGIHG